MTTHKSGCVCADCERVRALHEQVAQLSPEVRATIRGETRTGEPLFSEDPDRCPTFAVVGGARCVRQRGHEGGHDIEQRESEPRSRCPERWGGEGGSQCKNDRGHAGGHSWQRESEPQKTSESPKEADRVSIPASAATGAATSTPGGGSEGPGATSEQRGSEPPGGEVRALRGLTLDREAFTRDERGSEPSLAQLAYETHAADLRGAFPDDLVIVEPWSELCAKEQSVWNGVVAAVLANMQRGQKPLPEWGPDDKPIPEDAEIHAAFPTRSERHDLYGEAMRMVSAKYSKGALVALVNWLLNRIEGNRMIDAALLSSDEQRCAEPQKRENDDGEQDGGVRRVRGDHQARDGVLSGRGGAGEANDPRGTAAPHEVRSSGVSGPDARGGSLQGVHAEGLLEGDARASDRRRVEQRGERPSHGELATAYLLKHTGGRFTGEWQRELTALLRSVASDASDLSNADVDELRACVRNLLALIERARPRVDGFDALAVMLAADAIGYKVQQRSAGPSQIGEHAEDDEADAGARPGGSRAQGAGASESRGAQRGGASSEDDRGGIRSGLPRAPGDAVGRTRNEFDPLVSGGMGSSSSEGQRVERPGPRDRVRVEWPGHPMHGVEGRVVDDGATIVAFMLHTGDLARAPLAKLRIVERAE